MIEIGTRVIVNWDDIGKRVCHIHQQLGKGRDLNGNKLKPYYIVKTEDGKMLYSSMKNTVIDNEYYREEKLKTILE